MYCTKKQIFCKLLFHSVDFPQTAEKFIVCLGASNFRIREVLSQMKDGQEQIIACGSRTMNTAERSYCIAQQMLYLYTSINTTIDRSSACTLSEHHHGQKHKIANVLPEECTKNSVVVQCAVGREPSALSGLNV
jgi:shikimate kinase